MRIFDLPLIVYGSHAQRHMPNKHIKNANICVVLVFFTSTLVDVGDWHLGQIMCVDTALSSSLSTKKILS